MKKIITAVFSALLIGSGLITTSSTTINATVATSNSTSKKMNFKQIKKGNYTSLLGKWKQVAGMHNDYHKGITWYKLDPKKLSTLKVHKHKITAYNGYITFQGKYMTDNNKKKRKLAFSMYKKSLRSVSDDAILWEIDYYPKNVPIYDDKYHRKQPKEIDNKKDRIVIFCSNMGSTAVFQRN